MFSKILPVEGLNKVRTGSSPGFSTWHHMTMVRTLSQVRGGAMAVQCHAVQRDSRARTGGITFCHEKTEEEKRLDGMVEVERGLFLFVCHLFTFL